MALFDFVTDLFFDDPEPPKADWDEIKKLMEFGIDKNRYDQNGLFTSYNWDDDKGVLSQTINENILPAYNRVMGGYNEGPQQYQGADKRQALLQAMMERARPRRPRPDIPERPEGPQRPPMVRPPSYNPGDM